METPISQVWIEKEYKEGDIDLGWNCKGVGFGHIAFYEKEGKIYCNNETMGKDFVKAVLIKLVDESIFTE